VGELRFAKGERNDQVDHFEQRTPERKRGPEEGALPLGTSACPKHVFHKPGRPLSHGFQIVFRNLAGPGGAVYFPFSLAGQVAEWLKAHAWKVCNGESRSRVRIPLCPPNPLN
jgi:hypothetical protein